MPQILRILDANANRAREALRVAEEAARFLLDDQLLCEAIKQLRHDLAAALSRVAGLTDNRDTPGDVGTQVTTPSESSRADTAAVVTAAGKRMSEALRSIEEYGKLLEPATPGFAGSIEAIRYRWYDVEQRLNRAMQSTAGRQWKLCVLISESLCPEGDWLKVARAACDGGADCIQLREKDCDAGELLVRAKQLVALCKPSGVSVIINDRPDVALLSGADGVHLGQSDFPCREARKLVGNQLLIGVSTSCLDEAKQALQDGASYCGVGPMFHTTTKHKPILAGPTYLKQVTDWGKLPHLAIGGINSQNIAELRAAGVQGIAVSSAVCAASDPRDATAKLISALSDNT